MFCRIVVMGRLTTDPELRNTPSNVSVTSFAIAVNRPYVNKNGERQTDFFNVVAWRNQAEFICKYFKKGNCILIDGRLENRDYIDKNGIKQRVSEIITENVSFTGERPVNNYNNNNMYNNQSMNNQSMNNQSMNNGFMSNESNNFQQPRPNSFENINPGSFEEIEGDDDLPF